MFKRTMVALTEQELHNLGMNIVGKRLQKMGYEFISVNSKLKKHPQFVIYKKNKPTIFVLVKVSNNLQHVQDYDAIWMETFKEHARKQGVHVWFAGVGLANAESIEMPVFKDQPYYVSFDNFIKVLE